MMRDEGFTIIETLVALAILAVALVTLYGAAATSLRATQHVAKTDQVLLLAQSKLDEIATVKGALPPQSSGEFPGGEIHWSITTEKVQDAWPSAALLQNVHLTLEWRDGLNNQSLSIETRHLGAVRP
jgi:general secretion pathway protein I